MPPAAASAAPARILVAEDNLVNLELVKLMLESDHYRVDTAVNGREAFEAWAKTGYDLIFMDCQMPEMDGYQTARRIRQNENSSGAGRHTPIIALTAHALDEDRDRCLEAGMDDHLSKPFRPRQLQEVLEKWLKTGAPPTVPDPPQHPSVEEAKRADACLDASALQRIRALENPSLFHRVIQLYLEETPKILQALREAAERSDGAVLRRSAHHLKSSSANLGAIRLAALCRQLENLARQGRHEESESRVTEIEAEFTRVRTALEAENGTKGA